MKLILATIIGSIVNFLMGGLFYMFLLADTLMKHMGQIYRPDYDFKMWAVGAGCFVGSLLLAIIYPRGYKGGSPMGEGLKFGLLMGLFAGLPTTFFMWASYKIGYIGAIADGIATIAIVTVTGLVIALVYGRGSSKA